MELNLFVNIINIKLQSFTFPDESSIMVSYYICYFVFNIMSANMISSKSPLKSSGVPKLRSSKDKKERKDKSATSSPDRSRSPSVKSGTAEMIDNDRVKSRPTSATSKVSFKDVEESKESSRIRRSKSGIEEIANLKSSSVQTIAVPRIVRSYSGIDNKLCFSVAAPIRYISSSDVPSHCAIENPWKVSKSNVNSPAKPGKSLPAPLININSISSNAAKVPTVNSSNLPSLVNSTSSSTVSSVKTVNLEQPPTVSKVSANKNVADTPIDLKLVQKNDNSITSSSEKLTTSLAGLNLLSSSYLNSDFEQKHDNVLISSSEKLAASLAGSDLLNFSFSNSDFEEKNENVLISSENLAASIAGSNLLNFSFLNSDFSQVSDIEKSLVSSINFSNVPNEQFDFKFD